MKYKVMRLICMFDLPIDTAKEKKAYRIFRKKLIQEGFVMMQYSVYIRVCPNRDYAKRIEKRLLRIVPPAGNVRTLMITEKQYEDIKIMVGTKRAQENAIGNERMIII